MFLVLLVMHGRLAMTEEKDMHRQFGAEYDTYAARTPRFIPSFGADGHSTGRHREA